MHLFRDCRRGLVVPTVAPTFGARAKNSHEKTIIF